MGAAYCVRRNAFAGENLVFWGGNIGARKNHFIFQLLFSVAEAKFQSPVNSPNDHLPEKKLRGWK